MNAVSLKHFRKAIKSFFDVSDNCKPPEVNFMKESMVVEG
jgi:hypothetical protein